MQRDREIRDNSNTGGSPFDDLGGFGFPGSMFPSLFGGKDPFSDPFFTTRHSSLFGSDVFSSSNPGNLQHTTRSKGPVIEELDSDAEEVPDAMEEDKGTDATWGNRNPIVEHPEDQSHGKRGILLFLVLAIGVLLAYNFSGFGRPGKEYEQSKRYNI